MRFFDAHLHIVESGYPLQENNGYLPDSFSIANYLEATEKLPVKLVGGVVVSGSFQGFDQSYIEAAIKALGEGFVGVTQIPASVSDAELKRLNEFGIRGVRFNLKRGGSESISKLVDLALRVYDLHDWHVELYIDAELLPSIQTELNQLPKYSIDHLGLSLSGLKHLYASVEQGAHVKATGFGRLNFDPFPAIKDLLLINPSAVMLGTDLPSTRAPRPFEKQDLVNCLEQLDEALCTRIFSANSMNFYDVNLRTDF